MHLVRKADYASEYELLITFEDGTARLVDLEPHLTGEIFEPLKDLGFFRRFRVDADLDTVVWENGADMSPDFLYEIGTPVPLSADPTRTATARKPSPR